MKTEKKVVRTAAVAAFIVLAVSVLLVILITANGNGHTNLSKDESMKKINDSDISAFFDECAENNAFESFSPEEDKKLVKLFERWDILPGMRIVEPGCGSGRLTVRLADAVGPGGQVYSFDLSKEMIKKALGRNLPAHVQFVCCSVDAIPVEDSSFDVAICFNVFPHFSDPGKSLDELHRVLKPGGKLWINHLRNRADLNDMHRNTTAAVIARDLPDAAEMKRLLDDHGFRVIELLDPTETGYSLCAVAVE